MWTSSSTNGSAICESVLHTLYPNQQRRAPGPLGGGCGVVAHLGQPPLQPLCLTVQQQQKCTSY